VCISSVAPSFELRTLSMPNEWRMLFSPDKHMALLCCLSLYILSFRSCPLRMSSSFFILSFLFYYVFESRSLVHFLSLSLHIARFTAFLSYLESVLPGRTWHFSSFSFRGAFNDTVS